jgi:hypothetical protein
MRKVILLIGIILGSIIVYGQKEAETYVIGIGEPAAYWEVLDFLKASPLVKVFKSCTLVQSIAVVVVNKEFKDYNEFLLYLNFNFDELRVYRKDMSIFVKECDDEPKK